MGHLPGNVSNQSGKFNLSHFLQSFEHGDLKNTREPVTRARGCMAETQTLLLSASELGECMRGVARPHTHTHKHLPHTAA